MIEGNPLVSVIVPSYNHGKYITQCIESIVSQSYKNWELIVIDDGSSDNSREIIETLEKKYDIITCYKKNQGISATLNLGILKYSKGKYITFCASDDFWPIDKLKKQVAFLEENKFYPMCYGKSYFVDKNSQILDYQEPIEKIFKKGDFFSEILLFNIHPPVNYMFRAEIFKELGLYNEKLAAEDYDMNLRISNKYAIGYIDDFLGFYRYDDSLLKLERFDRISDSHLYSIENYKEHRHYNKAKAIVYLRRFDTFSGYKKLKIKALKNIVYAFPVWYKKRFMIAFIKMFIFWKS